MDKNEDPNVQIILAIQHAYELFEVYRTNEEQDEFGVTDLSLQLGLHKNNVFRLLATLSNGGYIEQNLDTDYYRLGINLFTLGQRFINKLGFLKISRPFMERLVSELDESCYIGILRKKSVVYLDVVESRHPVKVHSRIGNEVPAYASAIGKVQLAYLSNDELNALYKGYKFEKFTPATCDKIGLLKKQLSVIKEQEYAVDYEEYQKGVFCISVPIKDNNNTAIAAISISCPLYRITTEKVENLFLPTMKKYAKEISKRLGFNESLS